MMREAEFAAWLPAMRERYAESMILDGGFGTEAARAKSERDIASLFPGNVCPAGQSVYLIEVEGDTVGELWVGEADDDGTRCLWIYNVEVAAGHRGRGFGREAMLFAEDEARRRGIGRITLNVFGRNQIARGLYRALGYEERAVRMSKTV